MDEKRTFDLTMAVIAYGILHEDRTPEELNLMSDQEMLDIRNRYLKFRDEVIRKGGLGIIEE